MVFFSCVYFVFLGERPKRPVSFFYMRWIVLDPLVLRPRPPILNVPRNFWSISGLLEDPLQYLLGLTILAYKYAALLLMKIFLPLETLLFLCMQSLSFWHSAQNKRLTYLLDRLTDRPLPGLFFPWEVRLVGLSIWQFTFYLITKNFRHTLWTLLLHVSLDKMPVCLSLHANYNKRNARGC